mgnify:CR=1 FL=1
MIHQVSLKTTARQHSRLDFVMRAMTSWSDISIWSLIIRARDIVLLRSWREAEMILKG